MAGAALRIRNAIARRGLTPLASVLEDSRATDIAFRSANGQHFIVRCVHKITQHDYRDLETMLAQGDFARAAIVYTAEDQPHLSGEIESWPISRLDELAASLALERAP